MEGKFLKFAVLSALLMPVAAHSGALPPVNLNNNAVSARAALGANLPEEKLPPIKLADLPEEKLAPMKKSDGTRTVMARGDRPSGDYLIPKRPTANLWTKTESRTEGTNHQMLADNNVVRTASAGVRGTEPTPVQRDEYDTILKAEMARLAEMQRKAEKQPVQVAAAEPTPSRIESYAKPSAKRMIVDMDDMPEPIVRRAGSAQVEEFAYNNPDDIPFTKLSPTQLKKAFQKTYISENKHLSTYPMDDDFSEFESSMDFSLGAAQSLTERATNSGVRTLEIKLGFRGDDSGLSRDNYNLLASYASLIVSDPKRAVLISIPEADTRSFESRRRSARRLALIEQVLKDNGLHDRRIMPVLSDRERDTFVLRVITTDQVKTMTAQRRDMFGDQVSEKSYKSMSW